MALFQDLSAALDPHGLILRGGFHDGETTLYLIGHGGSSFWQSFFESDYFNLEKNPLDRWTKAVVGDIALEFEADAIYPSDGPPYAPFQQWVKQTEGLQQSPIGMMIHPEFGLWHAYRAAIRFQGKHEIPSAPKQVDLCGKCAEKPCLRSCPVGAFSRDVYNVPNCVTHLKAEDKANCMGLGCFARRNCPHGQDYIYHPDHAAFHMKAFCNNH